MIIVYFDEQLVHMILLISHSCLIHENPTDYIPCIVIPDFALSGWWFQTFGLVFHNIWDNPSH
jgi:hypothetical protein